MQASLLNAGYLCTYGGGCLAQRVSSFLSLEKMAVDPGYPQTSASANASKISAFSSGNVSGVYKFSGSVFEFPGNKCCLLFFGLPTKHSQGF